MTGSLNNIWHGLGEHCSSNAQCGPDACCVKVWIIYNLDQIFSGIIYSFGFEKPTIQGKRAITDGNNIHFARFKNL